MKNIIRYVVAPLFLVGLCGCVGPLVQELEIDEETATRIRSDVKTATQSDLGDVEYKSLGMVTATSCFNNFVTDKISSRDDAMAQLRYKASTVGANAILNPICQSEGTNLAKNCWSSITCSAGAVHISEHINNQETRALSSGTCFVASPSGEVITNAHVVEGAKNIYVTLSSGLRLPGVVKIMSRTTDIALLEVGQSNLPYLSLSSTKDISIGLKVFTLGYPATRILGDELKFTDGSISALSGVGGEPSLMQTTVPIQPGNSGGPLMSEKGYVLGIMTSTAAVSAFYEKTGALPQNINWAVKSDYASLLFKNPNTMPPTFRRSEPPAPSKSNFRCRSISGH